METLELSKKSLLSSIVIVYDGECIYCHAFIRFLYKNGVSTNENVFLIGSETIEGSDILSLLNIKFKSMLYIQEGVVLSNSHAFIASVRHLDSNWRHLQCCRFVPCAIRDLIYDLISFMRIFFRREKCFIDMSSTSNKKNLD